MLSLIPLNIDSTEHINFSYKILKAKITSQNKKKYNDIPAVDEHVNILKSNIFKYIYIGLFNNTLCFIIYVKQQCHEIEFYFEPTAYSKIYHQYKNEVKSSSLQLAPKTSLSRTCAAIFIEELFKLHPDLRNKATCKVDKNNKLGHSVMNACKFKATSNHYIFCENTVSFEPLFPTWSMRQINVNNTDDLQFTYEILKMRFDVEYINIGDKRNLPTINQHKEYLKTSYLFYYIFFVNDISIGTIYVSKDYELGFFYHRKNFVKALQTIRNDVQSIMLNFEEHNVSRGHIITTSVGKYFVGELIRLHGKELLGKLKSSCNPDNKWANISNRYIGLVYSYTQYKKQ
jgi:hypothetical protein